jgi:NTP pyrophosphatase (non-canonical NTP hydrolase)
MQLAEYCAKAIRTNKELGSESANCSHMVIGMFSEINELTDAINRGDRVNIIEEVGDFSWYFFNYCTIRKINLLLPLKPELHLLSDLTYYASKLSDTVKKFLIYNKEINKEEERLYCEFILECLFGFAYVSPDREVFQIDLHDAFQRNIDKLEARYKNATYSDAAAVNRNLNAERAELEK